jgi:hypothetical protein
MVLERLKSWVRSWAEAQRRRKTQRLLDTFQQGEIVSAGDAAAELLRTAADPQVRDAIVARLGPDYDAQLGAFVLVNGRSWEAARRSGAGGRTGPW